MYVSPLYLILDIECRSRSYENLDPDKIYAQHERQKKLELLLWEVGVES